MCRARCSRRAKAAWQKRQRKEEEELVAELVMVRKRTTTTLQSVRWPWGVPPELDVVIAQSLKGE